MATKKSCIICGGPSKSNEHIFPAALGGRRTNRGIYCQVHNNGFGVLVARLETQLAMMNSLLEVRPDRKDQAKPFFFMDGDTRFRMEGPNIEVDMPPPLDLTTIGSGATLQLAVPNMEVARRWIQANETDEIKLEIQQTSSPQRHYQTKGKTIRLGFGGCDFLQAVGYLALTFFAHCFPGPARDDGLKPFKDMLLRELHNDKENWKEEFVWWDGRDPADVTDKNPYTFGHVVAVGICDLTSHAYAYISFFGCLNFGVDFGRVEYVGDTKSVYTFIDPLADSAANSVTELKQTKYNDELGKQGISLYDMIHSGIAAAAFGKFMQKVGDHQADKVVNEIFSRVPDQPLPTFEGVSHFLNIAHDNGQPLFNFIRKIAEDMATNSELQPFGLMLRKVIAEDVSQPNGLNTIAMAMLQAAMHLVAAQMQDAHEKGVLDAQTIYGLFFDWPGYELVFRQLIVPIISSGLRQ